MINETLTGVLVVITGLYTWITNRTLDILKEAQIAEARPLLSVQCLPRRRDANSMQLEVRLENLGRGPALTVVLVLERAERDYLDDDDTITWHALEVERALQALGAGSRWRRRIDFGSVVGSIVDATDRAFARVTVRMIDGLGNVYVEQWQFGTMPSGRWERLPVVRHATWWRPANGEVSLATLNPGEPGAGMKRVSDISHAE